jgi:hypothetical protein
MNSNQYRSCTTERNGPVIAIVATLVLLGVVAITVSVTIPLQQQADAAGCESGFLHGGGFFAFNASQGHCFGH